MSNRPVLILTGPPGAGKSTTAAILAERAAAGVHLESDVFFRFIRGGGIEPWRPESHEQNEVVMRIVGEAAGGVCGGRVLHRHRRDRPAALVPGAAL